MAMLGEKAHVKAPLGIHTNSQNNTTAVISCQEADVQRLSLAVCLTALVLFSVL